MCTAAFRREANPACVRFRVGIEGYVLNCTTPLEAELEAVVDGIRKNVHVGGIFHFG